MSHWKGVVKGNLKVKGDLTWEWKDYLPAYGNKVCKKKIFQINFLFCDEETN